MTADDASNGWDAVAEQLIRLRGTTRVGAQVIRSWSQLLPAGAAVLDLGCGAGVPVATELAQRGFDVHGVDASPRLVAQFRSHLPQAQVECNTVQDSGFFGRRFDGIVAVGLMFLLPEHAQAELISKVGRALHAGGRFLLAAPWRACEWTDILTGRRSVSLGAPEYERRLRRAGMSVTGHYVDEGESYYFSTQKDHD